MRWTAAAATVVALAGAANVVADARRPQPLAAAARTGHVVIIHAGYRPRRFYPDNRTVATKFRWTVWTQQLAVGHGTTRTCAPGGLDCTTTRQTIAYTRPRHACGVETFTRFRYSRFPARGTLSASDGICIWISGPA